MRTVTVRYLVPIYVTVDLDAKADERGGYYYYPDAAISRVWEGDESVVRLDDAEGVAVLTSGDVIDTSYDDYAVNPKRLRAKSRAKALDVAEHTLWPIWERG